MKFYSDEESFGDFILHSIIPSNETSEKRKIQYDRKDPIVLQFVELRTELVVIDL